MMVKQSLIPIIAITLLLSSPAFAYIPYERHSMRPMVTWAKCIQGEANNYLPLIHDSESYMEQRAALIHTPACEKYLDPAINSCYRALPDGTSAYAMPIYCNEIINGVADDLLEDHN